MLLGKTIGPFTIEKEIGAGAMGTVYRAKHGETGKWVAIKVIAPGLVAKENVKLRFEREWGILKQLKHPNIVRLIATGRIAGTPFYAMEFVEGEGLDEIMARRGRIDWEEVVRLGRQLCAALQHAHEKGIVHRDLKPSNVMVLTDGTVKLTDFGIAKDLDRTAITDVNCTVGTAAYMSPEQCKGDRNLTFKSDLYSLGVMFYELLTGKKPFDAESTLDMFMQHLKGKFQRPARLALDVPVFLDTLVCQLLEKQPDRRPYDAKMVAEALERVEEKVTAQQAAGIDAARTRNQDLPKEAARLEDEDKEAARALLGKKKKKRREEGAFYQRTWFKGVALAGLLLTIGVVFAVVFLVKPGAESLYRRADQAMASGDAQQRLQARQRDGAIYDYLRYYGDRDDEATRKVRQWADDIDREQCEERLLKRFERQDTIGLDADEKAYRKGLEAENAGNLKAAGDVWAQLAKNKEQPQTVEYSEERSVGLVALSHLRLLDEVDHLEKKLQEGKLAEASAKDFQKKAAEGLQWEQKKDHAKARKAWEEFQKGVDQYASATRIWWLLAAKHIHALAEAAKKSDDGRKDKN